MLCVAIVVRCAKSVMERDISTCPKMIPRIMINRNFEDISVKFRVLTRDAPGWYGTWAVEDVITLNQFLIIPFGYEAELRYTINYTSNEANNTFGMIGRIDAAGSISEEVLLEFEQKINNGEIKLDNITIPIY